MSLDWIHNNLANKMTTSLHNLWNVSKSFSSFTKEFLTIHNRSLHPNGCIFANDTWQKRPVRISIMKTAEDLNWRCISKSSLSTDDFEPRKLKYAIIDSFSFVSFVSAFCFNYFLKISSSRSWYSDYYANPEFRCFVFLLWFTVQKH